MRNQFDELTKSMAQSVTRRAALKKFGVGLAGMALACSGLAGKARAASGTGYCMVFADPSGARLQFTGYCLDATTCQIGASNQCRGNVKRKALVANPCNPSSWAVIDTNKPCSF